MTKSELALNKFRNGYNCCQAVACAFAEELGIDESVLYRIGEGFGRGMGCGKGACGALSGAVMVAGLVNSNGDIEHAGMTKAATLKLSGSLFEAFEERVGANACEDIKKGPEGPLASCAECIAIAAEITEQKFFSK